MFSVSVAHVLPALSLVALSLTGSNATMAVVILTVAVTVIGAYSSGFFQSPMDVAPNFAGRDNLKPLISVWILANCAYVRHYGTRVTD